MAYQNILTPRIFVSLGDFFEGAGSIHNILPVNKNVYSAGTTYSLPSIEYELGNYFIALLGHSGISSFSLDNTTDIINASDPLLSGFSIMKSSLEGGDITINADGNYVIGSVVGGFFYEFPHSPELNLSLSYEYDGTKETTTRGGHTLTQSFHDGPPLWGNALGAWEIVTYATDHWEIYPKSGRRVWDLSFSYLEDSSIFPKNASLENTMGAEWDESSIKDDTLFSSNTFQRVMHFTKGGRLPFIFQGDKETNKPDQYAIAKFDMKEFKFDQVANNVYNIKLKIREIW